MSKIKSVPKAQKKAPATTKKEPVIIPASNPPKRDQRPTLDAHINDVVDSIKDNNIDQAKAREHAIGLILADVVAGAVDTALTPEDVEYYVIERMRYLIK